MRRNLFPLLFSVGSLLALVHGCSDDDAAATSAADAGAAEASALDRAPFNPDPPGDSSSGITCEPQALGAFKPKWRPPTALRQARCSSTQTAAFADCAYNHAGYDAAKCAAFNAEPANADCIACAAPPATQASAGATVATALSTNVNYGGCVAALTGDPSASGCGSKIQAAEQCQLAACESACPVAGNGAQFAEFTKCLDDAWQTVCLEYSSATSCADDFRKGTGAAAACYPATTDFGVLIRTYVDLFCGSTNDGGSDAPADASDSG